MSLLPLDPELAAAVPPERAELARRALHAKVIEHPAGALELPSGTDACLGVLVIDGLLTRTVKIGTSHSVEPLGPGDLLRPWQEDAVSFVGTTFSVLVLSRLALLDTDLVRRIAHFPSVIHVLVDRAMRRSRFMAVSSAIDGLVGVHRRVLALMWALSERWGTVQDRGVFLPIALQHEDIAGLVAARRPSVSTAISRLQRENLLERADGGWIVKGSAADIGD